MNPQFNKLNFTIGPVKMSDEIRRLSALPIPYFRTSSFSGLMLENELLLKELLECSDSNRVLFLTGSGTMAMEAAIMNSFHEQDKVLVINGGTFGERFTNICKIHHIPFYELKLPYGKSLTKEHLEEFNGKGFTGLLLNMHETSTGLLYDMNLIHDFCKKNQLFLVVDAISSFLADEIKMQEWEIDVLILSSQKALALPPGLSMLVLSDKAVKQISLHSPATLYLDMKEYLKDGIRGQTPFTPAVHILLLLNKRLKEIQKIGVAEEIQKVKNLAEYFRKEIAAFPFTMLPDRPSNAVTALLLTRQENAPEIVKILEERYGIWICPNGGALRNKVVRVGHIGAQEKEEVQQLIWALKEIYSEKA